MRSIAAAPAAAVISIAFAFPAAAADYESAIKPLLQKRCVSCHGPLKQKAGLPANYWSEEMTFYRYRSFSFSETGMSQVATG